MPNGHEKRGVVYLFALSPLLVLAGVVLSRPSGVSGWWLPGLFVLPVLPLLSRKPRLANACLGLVSAILFLALMEGGSRLLTDRGIVSYYQPIRIMRPKGVEDWRNYHVNADPYSEPDPELLWIPPARPPYNQARFKGPEPVVPKPPGLFRIFCYGDSNTDGFGTVPWPQHLENGLRQALGEASVEVENAGVIGYSSFQGLERFRRNAPRYQPDLIMVSFGWNDAAPALGSPDKSYKAPPRSLAVVRKFLLRYRFYLVLKSSIWRLEARRKTPHAIGARVPLNDYQENLDAFVRLGRERGARCVLMTRPFDKRLESRPGWRERVPAYNDAVRHAAARLGAPLIDAERFFDELHPGAFQTESHLTPKGQQLLGEQVASELLRAGLAGAP